VFPISHQAKYPRHLNEVVVVVVDDDDDDDDTT